MRGGGLVSGSLVLLGGDPGVGKSTLAGALARQAQLFFHQPQQLLLLGDDLVFLLDDLE